MAILTNKPASVSADSTTSLTLNKADLQAKLVALNASAYWQDQNAWKGVALLYQNADQQNITVSFDASGNTANLTVSEYFVNGNIECKRIDVVGFANDYYTILRKDFTSASESDIQITSGYVPSGGGGGGAVVWDTYINGHIVEADGGIYGPISGGSPANFVAATGNPIPANTNGEFTFVFKDKDTIISEANDLAFGIGPFSGIAGISTYFGLGINNGVWILDNNSLVSPAVVSIPNSGEVNIRIAREGSNYKIYVNNALSFSYPVINVAGHSVSSILVPSVRTRGNAINTGIIAASKTI